VRILLFGAEGQLGWELRRSLSVLGSVEAITRNDGLKVDLEKPESLRICIQSTRPDVIVNAAAYTDVVAAETQQEMAFRINAEAPRVMAEEAKQIGALFVHYSTDYVFDGNSSSAYDESSKTAPLNLYGKSKLAGDMAITQSGCDYLVFRTSWVYSARRKNFLSTMLPLLTSRQSLSVVCDQVGAPTSAELIADITAHGVLAALNDRKHCGLYHLAASGEASWWQFAVLISEQLRAKGMRTVMDTDAIKPVTSADYAGGVARPLNSRMSCDRLRKAFGLHLPRWEDGVARVIDERFSLAEKEILR